jgi:hypothetical protein
MRNGSTNKKEREAVPPISFEEHSKDVQQYLLRGLAQQINELSMPQLGVVQQMFAKAGLTVVPTSEAKKYWRVRKQLEITNS